MKREILKLQEKIMDYLNNYDVVAYAKRSGIELDSWLKLKLFELLSEIRTGIIMIFSQVMNEAVRE